MIFNWWNWLYGVYLQDNVKSKMLIINCGVHMYGDNFVMCHFKCELCDVSFQIYNPQMMYLFVFVNCYRNGLGIMGQWPYHHNVVHYTIDRLPSLTISHVIAHVFQHDWLKLFKIINSTKRINKNPKYTTQKYFSRKPNSIYSRTKVDCEKYHDTKH